MIGLALKALGLSFITFTIPAMGMVYLLLTRSHLWF